MLGKYGSAANASTQTCLRCDKHFSVDGSVVVNLPSPSSLMLQLLTIGDLLLTLPPARVEELIAAGIVITGGSAKMEGAVELAEEVFHMPVRLGAPQYVD